MILRATLPRLFAYVVVAGLGIVTSAVVVRALGVEPAGLYFSVLSLGWVTFSVSDFNLSSIALREASIGSVSRQARHDVLRDILGFRLLSWTIAWPVASLIATQTTDGFSWSGCLLVYIWLGLTIITATQQIPLQSQMRQGLASALLISQAVLGLATASLLVTTSAPDWAFLGTQIPGMIVSLLVLMFLPFARLLIVPRLNTRALVALLRAHWLLGLATVCAVVANRLGPLITLTVAGAFQAGLYGTAFRFVDAIEAVAPLLLSVLLPVLTRKSQGGNAATAEVLLRTMSGMLLLGVSGGFLVAIWGPVLLPLLAGSGFAGLHAVFLAFGVFLAVAFILQPLNYVLLATRRNGILFVSSVIGVLVLLVASYVLARVHGAAGAAWATAAGFGAMATASALGASTYGRGRDLASLLARGLLFALLTFVAVALPGSAWLKTVAGLALGAVAAVSLRIVNKQDLRAIIPVLGRRLS